VKRTPHVMDHSLGSGVGATDNRRSLAQLRCQFADTRQGPTAKAIAGPLEASNQVFCLLQVRHFILSRGADEGTRGCRYALCNCWQLLRAVAWYMRRTDLPERQYDCPAPQGLWPANPRRHAPAPVCAQPPRRMTAGPWSGPGTGPTPADARTPSDPQPRGQGLLASADRRHASRAVRRCCHRTIRSPRAAWFPDYTTPPPSVNSNASG
jgi:hypothetical protein